MATPTADRDALDKLDLKILDRYQRSSRTPAEAIAAEVGLSAAAVQRRLKRLRETGVIQNEAGQIDPAAVGLAVTCLVAVELDRESGNGVDRFRSRVSQYDEVQQCYYVTGQADFMLIVNCKDMAAYEAFTREALLADGNVRSFTTSVVLERVKVGLQLPIRIA
ncbi:MAG: Lrp/AsnC family transcriptional regulator [Cytophagales bacterium]|nr:Lrp/AsnC family transcriptional regulator [Rhizobacter sp.]